MKVKLSIQEHLSCNNHRINRLKGRITWLKKQHESERGKAFKKAIGNFPFKDDYSDYESEIQELEKENKHLLKLKSAFQEIADLD